MIKADAELAGGLDDPASLLRKAVVKLDNVQVAANGLRPAISGMLRLADEKLVSEGLEMRIGENRASIAMSAGNLSGQTITVKADVLSERFLLDPLLGAGGAAGSVAESVAKKGRTSAAGSEEIGPFDIPLRASGTIRIGRTVYKGLTIDDFNAIYELRDNVLTISRLDGKLAGGSFANTARVDLGTRGLAYSADLGIRAIQADPLLSAFIPKAAGALLGAMNLDLNIKGRGTRWQTMSRRLNGTGDMLIADGRVVSPALVKGFSTFLQLSKTDEIRFKNLQGDIRIVDGKVLIDGSLLSDELKLFPSGSIGLDGTMDLSVDTRLSPELAARFDAGGRVTKYLTDRDGWSQVPLLVSGSYASPRFRLDAKGLQRQASDAIGMELGRHLDKLFGAPAPALREEEQGQTGQDSEPAEDPTSRLLQDSLKSLFGN
jgi:AsmA protein